MWFQNILLSINVLSSDVKKFNMMVGKWVNGWHNIIVCEILLIIFSLSILMFRFNICLLYHLFRSCKFSFVLSIFFSRHHVQLYCQPFILEATSFILSIFWIYDNHIPFISINNCWLLGHSCDTSSKNIIVTII